MFEKLFEPIKIGKMELKNRIVMPPMYTKFGTEFGAVTDRMINFYVACAKGGAALLTIENTCVEWPRGKCGANPLRVDDDKFIQGLNELTEAVHLHGSKIATNPQHAGRQSDTEATEGVELIAPSSVPPPAISQAGSGYILGATKDIPRAMTIEEVREVEDKFVEAARRTKAAGMDSVELHAAHGYIFSNFFSPRTNLRSDLYGGTLENRARFAVEVIQKIKQKLGDFPVIYRFSAEEYVEGGTTIGESIFLVQKLEEAGVDAFHVSCGEYDSIYMAVPCFDIPPGVNLKLSEKIKKVVNVPVITVGKFTPELAEEAIKTGKADIIAFGRPLFADPELPNKVFEGRLDDIRPCIYCNEGCFGRLFRGLPPSCDVNYEHGYETKREIKLAEEKKNVLVIGGGPAGMEAARVAALRGHKVTLHEKGDRLGGQFVYASAAPFKEDFKPLLTWFQGQLKKHKVKVELGKESTPGMIDKLGPDAVIVATGANPKIPEILVDSKKAVRAIDVLSGKVVGQRVVVAGGGQIGCETAWFLAGKGKEVSIVEQQPLVSAGQNVASQMLLVKRLRELKVSIITNTFIDSITEDGVVVIDRSGKYIIEADTVVLALGVQPEAELAEQLKGKINKLYIIGDCSKPQIEYRLRNAIHEGSRVAREI
jgi:2,4-dienoyl-CoA reductase-like NADH-dependent reductase (Old Yellow Enzyme family)/thioredoxin reductase